MGLAIISDISTSNIFISYSKKALTFSTSKNIITKAKQEPPASHPPAFVRRGQGNQ